LGEPTPLPQLPELCRLDPSRPEPDDHPGAKDSSSQAIGGEPLN